MKANQLKIAMLALLISAGAITLAKDKDAGPRTSAYWKEHQDIRADLKSIDANKAEIADLKAELKADRKAGLKGEVIVDNKELAKAKADLRAGKAYLRADKKDLLRDRKLAIQKERKNVCEKRTALNEAKRALRKDLRTDNAMLIHQDAATAAYLMTKYEVAKIALQEEKIERNNDVIAVNEEIRAAKPGLGAGTYVESSQAHVSNWLLQ